MTIDLCIWTLPFHLFFCRRGYKMLQNWRKFFKIPRKALENPMFEIECSHLKNSWQARWIICMPSLSLMSSLLFAGVTGTESDRWVNVKFRVERQRYPDPIVLNSFLLPIQDVLKFLENRKENKAWYKGSTIAVSVSIKFCLLLPVSWLYRALDLCLITNGLLNSAKI